MFGIFITLPMFFFFCLEFYLYNYVEIMNLYEYNLFRKHNLAQVQFCKYFTRQYFTTLRMFLNIT